MDFASDNIYAVHPQIMAALDAVNHGTAPAYSSDEWTARAEHRLSEVFEREVKAFLVVNGTAANGLALSALTPPYGAIFCHHESHIAASECNGPEFFTGGAKLIGLPGEMGKITPQQVELALSHMIKGVHDPKPATISLTNATEFGTLYRPEEIKAFAHLARQRGLKLHMDGARFANALASLDVTPAALSWQSGVDVLSFGATKNGAMMLEAVIFFDPELATDFAYRRMRAGQLLSKGRYLSAQMLAYLDNNLWLENAVSANLKAENLRQIFAQHPPIRLACPVESNSVFAILPISWIESLYSQGFHFYDWSPASLKDDLKPGREERLVRFLLSYATPKTSLNALAEALDRLAAK